MKRQHRLTRGEGYLLGAIDRYRSDNAAAILGMEDMGLTPPPPSAEALMPYLNRHQRRTVAAEARCNARRKARLAKTRRVPRSETPTPPTGDAA